MLHPERRRENKERIAKMDIYKCKEVGVILVNDEIFEIVRESYAEANKDYIQQQIQIASEYLTDEQIGG